MAILVSPSERDALRIMGERGISSSLPEAYGGDFLIASPRGWVGIQRKQFPDDFFSSRSDGRIAKEVAQMEQLPWRFWLMEGSCSWTNEGFLEHDQYSRWHKRQVRNMLRSMRMRHEITVEWTIDVQDTVAAVYEIEAWFANAVHLSMDSRPKQVNNTWGKFDNAYWARFVLQGFPGIGAGRADAMYGYFGRVPLKWDVTKAEMQKVPTLGPKMVDSLFDCLPGRYSDLEPKLEESKESKKKRRVDRQTGEIIED